MSTLLTSRGRVTSRGLAFVWSLVVAAGSSAALAQFVTPPPASNPDPNKDIPKAPAPPPPPPAAAPSAPKIQQAKPVKEPIPNVPFKEWEKDASGNVLPLTEPLELASLRRNPLVTSDTMAKIDAYYPDRRKAMERIVIENLDLVEWIDGGLFEQTNFNDKGQVGQVVATTKPLTTPSLATELKNRQIIDDKAFGVNSRITTAYTKAGMPARKEGASAEELKKTNMASMGAIYKQGFVEHLWTYNELLVSASKDFGAKAGASKAEQAAAAKAGLSKMTLDERKAALRKISGYTAEAKPAEAKPVEAKAEPATK
ncbi:MAG: hypothetical protein NTV94_16410 [Planctomycetota bacterium]|nr:hypothetical protein [Planctomycetota bacterium]